MNTISLAIASRANTQVWRNTRVEWTDFVARLAAPQVTHESYAEYMAMPKNEQDRIKDVGGYVGGYLIGGRRKNQNLQFRDLLTLDLDFADMAFVDSFSLLYHWEAVIHSTHKHSSDNVRLRLIMRLSRSVTPDEYEAVGRWIAGRMGIARFDPTTFQPARLMFWPSHAKNGEWLFEHFTGVLIDVDAVLDSYVDWQDISEWPYHDGAGQVPRWLNDAKMKAENPLNKKGIVGVFCRTYDIDDVIREHLSEQYTPTPDPNRYTYTGGSTSGGLLIFEDMWAYSFHGTDPASGKLCNAFDLVRLHRFGHLDGGSTATGVKQKSYIAMHQWALTLPAVRAVATDEAIDEYKFDAVPDAGVSGVEGVEGDENAWHAELELDERARIKSSVFNVRLIMRRDSHLAGRFAFNEFDSRRYLMTDLGARSVSTPIPVSDVDYSYVRGYLESTYNVVGVAKIDDGVALEFQRNKFHPVRDYLTALEWDGEERIATTLHKVLGVDDNPYTREVLLRWMTAAVARVFNPGCKFDEMLVLVGPQGTGKSTFLRALGGAWYSDSFTTVSGKESFEQLQGAWVMEIAELSAFRKADAAMVKHFVSKQCDRFRPAYGRTVEDYPRQVVFAGTTNEHTFLTDTHNRRYWPVIVRPHKAKYTVWDSLFVECVGQLWAEAVHHYHQGTGLLLSPEANTIATRTREDHRAVDERTGLIEAYLDQLLPTDWDTRDLEERRAWLANPHLRNTGTVPRTHVCIMELWCECLGKSKEEASRYNTRELNDIIRAMDAWAPGTGTRTFLLYGRQRYYTYEL